MAKATSDQPQVVASRHRALLKLNAAADYLSLSPLTLRRLAKDGRIKVNRQTRHLLFPVTALDAFANE